MDFHRSRRWLLVSGMILLLFLSGPACASKPLTTEQKLADFEYMFSVLVENHPYLALKARTEGYDWASHHDEFEAGVRETKDDAEFAKVIRTILTLINNGHTGIADPVSATLVPRPEGIDDGRWAAWEAQFAGIDPRVAKRWWELSYADESAKNGSQMPCIYAIYNAGKYVVVGVSPELAAKVDVGAGYHVLTVNGQDVHAYVEGLRGTEWLRYDPIRRRVYQSVLSLPAGEVDIGLFVAKGTPPEIRSSGLTKSYSIPYSRPPVLDSASMNAPKARAAGNLYACVLGDDVGYLRVEEMTMCTLQNVFEEETSMLKDFFADIKDLPALIIDIRGNGGGQDPAWHRIVSLLTSETVRMDFGLAIRDGDLVRPIAEYLAKAAEADRALKRDHTPIGSLPDFLSDIFRDPIRLSLILEPDPESVQFDGQVFLLVDDRVYSSAENFAAFCKDSGWATLVGNPTGGDGLGFELSIFRLPYSGLVVKFPTAMGLNPDMLPNEEMHTLPDVRVEQSIDDLVRAVSRRPSGQPDPDTDPVLRRCLELARSANPPSKPQPAASWPIIFDPPSLGPSPPPPPPPSWAPTDGPLRWSLHTGDDVYSPPAADSSTVYSGSKSGTFFAVDKQSGDVKWHVQTGGPIRSAPRVSSGTAFFGSHDGKVYVVEREGQVKLAFKTEGVVESTPALDGRKVFFGSGDGNIYAVDRYAKKELWRHKTGGAVLGSPTVADGAVYIGSDDGHLYALDAETGLQQWMFRTGDSVDSTPVVSSGIVCFSSRDGKVYAVDAATGQEKWSFAPNGSILSSPASGEGLVFVGASDGNLYALRSDSGEIAWRYDTGNNACCSSPALAYRTVYFGCNEYLYALDSRSGSLMWRYKAASAIASPPAVSSCVVYFGCQDGSVCALGPEVVWSVRDEIPSPWASREVAEAISRRLIPDDMQGLYTKEITRLEFLKLAVYYLERYAERHPVFPSGTRWPAIFTSREYSENVFVDTNDYWANRAAVLGLAERPDDGMFHPDRPVSREEAYKTLIRVYARAASGWKQFYVERELYDDRFELSSNITREQAYSLILRLSKIYMSSDDGFRQPVW